MTIASKNLLSRFSAGMIRAAARLSPSTFADMALLEIGARSPDSLRKFVMEKATDIASKIMMASWDKQGIRHCAACPERFSLTKYGEHWLCTNHYKEVAAQVAVTKP